MAGAPHGRINDVGFLIWFRGCIIQRLNVSNDVPDRAGFRHEKNEGKIRFSPSHNQGVERWTRAESPMWTPSEEVPFPEKLTVSALVFAFLFQMVLVRMRPPNPVASMVQGVADP